MSKPLATKVSTPLSENVQIGPQSVNILCGHHYFPALPLPSWAWSSPELHRLPLESLEDVRDLALLHLPFEDAHRCSIGFRSGDMLGQSITFTLSFFSKAVVVLEVCLGSLCWNTALRPSLRREGIMLCFSMSQYMLAFMVPSMNCSSPVPVEPVLLNHCMVLATVLQLSFRVLAIFL